MSGTGLFAGLGMAYLMGVPVSAGIVVPELAWWGSSAYQRSAVPWRVLTCCG